MSAPTDADLRALCEEVRRLEETDGPWMGVLRSGDSGTVAQVLSTAAPLLAGECERLMGRVEKAEDAHKDRGALLALVRRVAEMDPFDDCGVCWCGEASPDHTPDCLWLLCQGVRE